MIEENVIRRNVSYVVITLEKLFVGQVFEYRTKIIKTFPSLTCRSNQSSAWGDSGDGGSFSYMSFNTSNASLLSSFTGVMSFVIGA